MGARWYASSGRPMLDKLGDPVRPAVQNRIQRLALAGHLENKFHNGSYEFLSDPRDLEK